MAGVDFCGLELAHPVINGSGTFDPIAARRAFGDAIYEQFPFSAFVSKTVTKPPRAGNPPPRLFEAASGLVNSIGLPNKGVDGFLAHELPLLAELPVPLIVSVMASDRETFAELVDEVAGRDEVAALELNISCPNVKSGLIVGENPDEAAALVERLRPVTGKPLIVKLTPNTAAPEAVAAAVEQAGADAVSLINTIKSAPRDPHTLEPWLGVGSGGLSGDAVRPIALDQVRRVAAAVAIPIVGMGGISQAGHAREFIAAGSTLVAVGTASFRDPLAARDIAAGLESVTVAT